MFDLRRIMPARCVVAPIEPAEEPPMSQQQSNTPDLSAFWMPFTANRQFKDSPRLLVSAKGM